jgi:drug/metabolite transporter (DMT)-like permease
MAPRQSLRTSQADLDRDSSSICQSGEDQTCAAEQPTAGRNHQLAQVPDFVSPEVRVRHFRIVSDRMAHDLGSSIETLMRDSTHHQSNFPRPRVDVWVRRRLCPHPVRVAVHAALGGRGDQYPDIDPTVLVSRTIFCGPERGESNGRCLVRVCWIVFSGAAALLNFESDRLLGPNIAGALSSMTPVLAVILAIVMLGERIRGPQLLGLAAIVVGISLMYRVHVNVSVRSLWLLTVPLAAAAIRGVVQPIIKFGFEWWPNPIAGVVVSYTVSSTVLIVSALVRTRWTIPDVDHRGALWFAVVGLCNGLSVLAMYAALEHGPVAVVSPIVAGYPLVTLLLSRAFLEQEQVGPQMIGGVTSAVCGVVLVLVT